MPQILFQDTAGNDIPQELQADAMAEHLESKQWHVRAGCGGHSMTRLFIEDLPIGTHAITRVELQKILAQLKNNRAPGSDAIPPEIWKAIGKDDNAVDVILHLCNRCWVFSSNSYIMAQSKCGDNFQKGQCGRHE